MKVLVCGGRQYKDWDKIASVLASSGATMVIHGGASGADSGAGYHAQRLGIQEVRCPANWDKHGNSAGYLRNSAMLKLQPDLVIAFPGGKGTAMMVKIAKEAGIPVQEVK